MSLMNSKIRTVFLFLLSLMIIELLNSYSTNTTSNDGENHNNLIPIGSSYYSPDTLIAMTYNSHFFIPDGFLWRGISAASRGKIYYVLSSHKITHGANMNVYNPKTNKVKFLDNLTKISGEGNLKAVPQAKSHTRLREYN